MIEKLPIEYTTQQAVYDKIQELIDEVNRLGKLTEMLVVQNGRQIKLWEELRDILGNKK